MERVVLGKSGLSVSPVAFGTWQLSERFWKKQSSEEAIRAMKLAFDKGVNFYDSSDAYGDGHAEQVLGDAVRQLPRDEIIIATKVFNHYNPDGSRYPDLSPDHIVKRCEASLKRLRIEAIDLYLLHFFDQLTPLADVAAAMKKLQDQGKVKTIGVSNHTVAQLRAQRTFGDYAVVQPAYSFVDPSIEKDLLPYCQAENLGVMIYSPLHMGLVTGKYKGDEEFDDFRRHHPDFRGERFKKTCRGVQSLKPLAEKYDLTLYQLILAATLMHPAIQVAICGIKTPGQIEEAVLAMGRTIDRPDYFAVRKALLGAQATKTIDASGTRK
jgi:aryl-alcohol dehydrogenase-like predicted oxidoreductase